MLYNVTVPAALFVVTPPHTTMLGPPMLSVLAARSSAVKPQTSPLAAVSEAGSVLAPAAGLPDVGAADSEASAAAAAPASQPPTPAAASAFEAPAIRPARPSAVGLRRLSSAGVPSTSGYADMHLTRAASQMRGTGPAAGPSMTGHTPVSCSSSAQRPTQGAGGASALQMRTRGSMGAPRAQASIGSSVTTESVQAAGRSSSPGVSAASLSASRSSQVGHKRNRSDDIFSIPIPSIVEDGGHPGLCSASKRGTPAARSSEVPQGPYDVPSVAFNRDLDVSDSPEASSSNPNVSPAHTPTKDGAGQAGGAGRGSLLAGAGVDVSHGSSEATLGFASPAGRQAGNAAAGAAGRSSMAGSSLGSIEFAPHAAAAAGAAAGTPALLRGKAAGAAALGVAAALDLGSSMEGADPLGASAAGAPAMGPARAGLQARPWEQRAASAGGSAPDGPLARHLSGMYDPATAVIEGYQHDDFRPLQALLQKRASQGGRPPPGAPNAAGGLGGRPLQGSSSFTDRRSQPASGTSSLASSAVGMAGSLSLRSSQALAFIAVPDMFSGAAAAEDGGSGVWSSQDALQRSSSSCGSGPDGEVVGPPAGRQFQVHESIQEEEEEEDAGAGGCGVRTLSREGSRLRACGQAAVCALQ